jgi:hypothetical protein
MPFLDLLEGHFALQFLVAGDGDLAESAAGVWAQDTEASVGR